MMTDFQIDCPGLAGNALKIMREKGWRMTSDLQISPVEIKEDIATYHVLGNMHFSLNDKPMSKADWDAEFVKVWNDLSK